MNRQPETNAPAEAEHQDEPEIIGIDKGSPEGDRTASWMHYKPNPEIIAEQRRYRALGHAIDAHKDDRMRNSAVIVTTAEQFEKFLMGPAEKRACDVAG